ncbi:MAG: methyltransferase domain-containing protein [archaeon]
MENNGIEDINIYNEKMRRSVLDKMFFIDKIPENTIIVDWGCADGSLLKEVIKFFPNDNYIGYDIDNKMVELCKKNIPNINVTSDINQLKNWLINKYKGKKVTINLSSILHELYSYRNADEIDKFWQLVFDVADIVVIRDMIFHHSMDRPSFHDDVKKVRKNENRRYVMDFEAVHGTIENNKNLIHYLLKYKYKNEGSRDNWEREVKENYLPLSREKLDMIIPNNFKIRYEHSFVLPYIQRQVENDFGIIIKDNTHLKLILEKV